MLVLASVSVVACSSPSPSRPAPVEDRGIFRSLPSIFGQTAPEAENAGRPGFYTVRPGDTLIRIGLDTGQNWRDLQAWNNLTNPDRLEVGQVLRVVPPGSAAPAPAVTAGPAVGVAPAPTTGTQVSPIAGGQVQERPLGSAGTAPQVAAAPATAPAAPAAPAPSAPVAASEEIAFIWPARGAVIDAFDEARNKGVGIAGRLGDPVMAAADGRVVYAGAGLRGYGNLVILKHNNTYLTAYAHNQALLVREDQVVRQGQTIAEMGSSDTDRVKLHFEVRRQGRPVDPMRHLPPR
ncbi:MAG: peptidoglycan DD-metalloendopeptidase family protein [Serpentinimonas sp.]|jgi:lipoprotein NlpD|nr:peptidoglycan DD-metalloendopeptidase family protein [Serpentinimonas sp.]